MMLEGLSGMIVKKMGPQPEGDKLMKYKEAEREAAKMVMDAMESKDIDMLNAALKRHRTACEMCEKAKDLY